MIALITLALIQTALAVCTADPFIQDLNCNGVDVVDEVPVDLTDPVCSGQLNGSGIPYPNADYYYDYVSYGCLVPVTALDLDHDGLSGGELALMPDETFPDVVVTLTCDNCPTDWNRDQLDTDCDNVGDICDVCPDVWDPAQADADGDGLGDFCDTCRFVAGVPQEDLDADFFGDACDNCPEAANDQGDDDADDVGDVCDVCWQDFNPGQEDVDLDGLGDICDICPDAFDPLQEDGDGDGIGDACDVCPLERDDQSDVDRDGFGDNCDVCTAVPDLEQLDGDNDLFGDACDLCPSEFDPQQYDVDHDGIGDVCDVCSKVYDPDQADADGDGTGDACQPCVGVGWDPGECAEYAARGGASTCGTPVAPGLLLVAMAIAFVRRRFLLLPFVAGCGFIPASEREWRLDPDADGAEWPEDCDSQDPSVVTGAPWFRDEDGDGWGGLVTQAACVSPGEGWVAMGEDCDDADPTIHRGAAEDCDGIDQNCDGAIDEGFPLFAVYADADGDGYGGPPAGEACRVADGTLATAGDCDDTTVATHPYATEVCDSADNDCDGLVDEALLAIWWPDADGDGYGEPASGVETCAPEEGWVARDGDCDDQQSDAFPYAPERCDDGRDNDCDGAVDETYTRWRDGDGDGFGDPATARTACEGDPDEVDNDVDCDDADGTVNPAVPEACGDGRDNDCDGIDDVCEGA